MEESENKEQEIKVEKGSNVYLDVSYMLNLMDKQNQSGHRLFSKDSKEDYLDFLSGSPLHTSNIVALETSDNEFRRDAYNDFIAEYKPAVSETIYFDIPAYSDMIQKIYDILGNKYENKRKHGERKIEDEMVSPVKDIVHSGTNGLSESKVAIDRKLETINIMKKLFIHPTNFLVGLQLLHCKEEPGINAICVSEDEFFQFKEEFVGKIRCYYNTMGRITSSNDDWRSANKKRAIGLYLITRIRYTPISDAEISEILFDMKYETTLLCLEKKRYTTDDIYLVQTCSACPEQYNALLKSNDREIGYLRLRHGSFTVDFPCCGEETIYEDNPAGDGAFEDDEREHYLNNAKQALVDKLNGEPISVKSSRGKGSSEMLYFALKMALSNSEEGIKDAIQEYKDYVNFKDKDAPADEDKATLESL